MRRIDVTERRARLGKRQLLAQPGGSLEETAGAMVGLHSSDPVTVYLSGRARVPGLARDDVVEALYERRSLLRMLGMRRTLFAVPRDLAAIIEPACAVPLAPAERRRLAKMLQIQGIAADADAWLDRVCDHTMAALEARGEAVARELSGEVPELKLKIRFGDGRKWGGEFGMSTRILFLLAAEGQIIRGRPRGSWVSSQYRWVPKDTWLGEPLPSVDTSTARAELLTRWLRTFGPGTMTDMKWWTGWSLRDTRAALEACGAVEVQVDDGVGFVLTDDIDPEPPTEPWAALLPGLDPTPMGWKERQWFLGDHGEALFDRNGNIGPTVWCDGRIVGGWAQKRDGEVVVRLLETVGRRHERLIEHRRAELREWLGDDRITPRFRSPLDKELASG
jgi:hypothetical protein